MIPIQKRVLAVVACGLLLAVPASIRADVIDATLSLTDVEFNREAERLAAKYPKLVRLGEIGRSQEGRRVTLLTVTAGDENKPGYFVRGNVHSKELSSSAVGLYLVRRLCEDRRRGDILDKVVFYFVPRCNPDGAERMIREPGDERSGWQRPAPADLKNVFTSRDIDGDGIIQKMLVKLPDGTLRFSARHPDCLVTAEKDWTGDRYVLMSEGDLRNWDGVTRFRRGFRYWADALDWNRDWPTGWKRSQWGAGDHPFSVPEIRDLAAWLGAHTNILAATDLHNGYEMLLGTDVRHEDFPHLSRIGKIGENLTGLPYIATSDVDMKESGKKQAGRFEEWCYCERGILCFTIELGTRENSAGEHTLDLLNAKDPYTAPYAVCEEQDRTPGLKPAYGKWRKFAHPQFGEVLLGGYCGSYFATPRPEWVRRNAEGAYRFILFHASDILVSGTGTVCGRK